LSKRNKLFPVEWEIMEAIWQLGGSPSVREVLEYAFPKGIKAYTTVQTIMNALEKKGFLTHKKIGLVNFYTPLKSRNEMVKSELSGMISRVFHGSVPAMANSLIDSQNLSLKEIEEIKALLYQKESKIRSKGDD
jgi:BlaI family penicillinase repressor